MTSHRHLTTRQLTDPTTKHLSTVRKTIAFVRRGCHCLPADTKASATPRRALPELRRLVSWSPEFSSLGSNRSSRPTAPLRSHAYGLIQDGQGDEALRPTGHQAGRNPR